MEKDCRSTGFQGEELACQYLVKKGYRIIKRNWRSKYYEIDIIAQDSDIIVFCEVKTSRTNSFGPSITWVTPEKVKRISKAAAEYIATHDTGGFSFRFDVIGLDIKGTKNEINHIKNAFTVPEDG